MALFAASALSARISIDMLRRVGRRSTLDHRHSASRLAELLLNRQSGKSNPGARKIYRSCLVKSADFQECKFMKMVTLLLRNSIKTALATMNYYRQSIALPAMMILSVCVPLKNASAASGELPSATLAEIIDKYVEPVLANGQAVVGISVGITLKGSTCYKSYGYRSAGDTSADNQIDEHSIF